MDRPARHVARPAAHAQARRLRRSASSPTSSASTKSAVREQRPSWSSCPPTSASTPARRSSSRSRRTSTAATRRRCEAEPTDKQKIIILGSGPNRIGQGIEFDYCCCHAVVRIPGGGLRDGHDQLQSGDGVDRLRHGRPALLRAADVRRRDGDHRARARGQRRRVVRRAVRRADAAEAGAVAAGSRRQDPRHLAGLDRSRRGPPALRAAAVGPRHPAAGERHGDVEGRGPRGRRRASASRWSCARPTCSAAAPWPSSTTWRRSTATWPAPWTCRTTARS